MIWGKLYAFDHILPKLNRDRSARFCEPPALGWPILCAENTSEHSPSFSQFQLLELTVFGGFLSFFGSWRDVFFL